MMDATGFAFRETFRMTQLRGILHDICKVYLLICKRGKKVANDENAIRDLFCDYLQRDSYKNDYTDVVRCYQVDTEVKEGEHGRTDIRFLKVKNYEGQKVYYTIECKRLDSSSHLCKEYVDNGIRRFTTNKYSTNLGCNAMLGFVVCTINLDATIDKVNNYLIVDEFLKTKSTKMTSMVGLESRHMEPHPFVLYHLWTDFSNLIVQESLPDLIDTNK